MLSIRNLANDGNRAVESIAPSVIKPTARPRKETNHWFTSRMQLMPNEPLTQGTQTGKGYVKEQDVGGRGHAEAGCAETQSGGYQHYSRPVPVGESADEGHQDGAQHSAGQVEYRNSGARQPRVLDYGVNEHREDV